MPNAIDLDHVAVAVEQLRDALPRYAGDLGGQWLSGGFGIGFAPGQLRYANGMKVEVLRPHRVEENDFLRRFLDRNGPGPHHLTFKVPDLDVVLAKAESSGYRPINVDLSDPDWQEAFLHPKDIPGILVQVAQAGGPEWSSDRPESWPEARTPNAAILEHVTHAVADLAEGLRLFADLLGGEELDRCANKTHDSIDLGWPGGGRVRLVTPTSTDSLLASWLGDRRGRVHDITFICEHPDEVPGAAARTDGTWEVPPELNLGVRLILRAAG